MRIELLSDHPYLIPTVAKWRWEEWGHRDADGSLATWTAALEAHCQRSQIPLTLIAFEGDQPVGLVSLVLHDMDTRKDLSPWLPGLYVRPLFRSLGIASSLIQTLGEKARDLGYEKLFLYTYSAPGLYEKLGWEAIKKEDYQGQQVVIMHTTLLD